nr:TonB-dependent receptor [Stenotrophomonas sp. MMGLT7]
MEAVKVSAPVTGSRVARDGFSAPTPTNVLSTEEIKAQAPADIATFVNTLPSVTGSQNSTSNSGSLSSGLAGISALSLRGLGAGRTLVLLDGQRSVPSSGTGLVDTNTFPQSLIRQVEVVTGGASSAYGSDAIGGVVNFILDRYYTGIKGTAEYSQTTYGDNNGNKFNLTGGWSFGDGRGHLLLSAETVRSDGIHSLDRDWAKKGHFAARNSAANIAAGGPTYVTGDDMGPTTYTPGGLVTSGPLRGTYFGVGGSVNQLAYGEELTSPWMVGGDWQTTLGNMVGSNSLAADDDRDSVFGRASFWVTDAFEVFAQASYARYEGLSYYIQPTQTGVTIQADNAYLPQSVKTQMDELGLGSLTIGTSNADMPASGSRMKRETQRFVVGGEGSFDWFGKAWNWDAYYQYGKTESREQLTDTFNTARLALATDAVVDPDGGVACRSTLVDPGNGCLPLNRLGIGVADPDALAWVLGAPRRDQRFEQQVLAVNFNTNEIPGWAGPISLAFGAEHRTEKMSGHVDEQWRSGWKYGNFLVTSGEYDVSEAYVETVVPLFAGMDFNGAVRYTDYSESGQVTTWKAGLVYAPIEDIAFRATVSRDIRAPNMEEMFAAGTARTNNATIPVNDKGYAAGSQTFLQNQIGNPDLVPEEADAHGVGVVFKPGFLPGFAASVDYYDIEISGVIATISVDDTVRYCFDNDQEYYCNNIFKDANGNLTTVNIYPQNFNTMRSRGLDIELSYRRAAGPGELTLRGMFTHYIENTTDNGVTAINEAGENTSSTPDWLYRLSAMYDVDDWRFHATARGVSSGVISNAYTTCTHSCPTLTAPYYTINDNRVDGEVYLDVGLSRRFRIGSAGAEAYFNIGNVLNTDPVLVSNPESSGSENMPGYPQTNRNLYDTLGRTFRVGLRLEF